MAISNEEKLQKIDTKMAQLKAQRQAIVNREKEKDRKSRTRRLIQNGALAEKYFDCEGMAPKDFEKVLLEITKGGGPVAPTPSAATSTVGGSGKV